MESHGCVDAKKIPGLTPNEVEVKTYILRKVRYRDVFEQDRNARLGRGR